VEFSQFVDHLSEQAAALRAAAVAAGPDAQVPTCPKWTVQNLVRHLAKVHNWTAQSLAADPAGESPHPPEPPGEFDDLLTWWDKQLADVVDRLRASGPDAPAWIFHKPVPHTAAFWARRQAHETAIHRLDLEHALAGSADPDAVPTLFFDQELAADGIDEIVHVSLPRQAQREPVTVSGTVLFHAADAGRAWLLHLNAGAPLEVGPAEDPAIDADATVVGTADAVYRAAWGRPSTAIRGGDLTLISALRAP
jgi:uncharacterized protein (TIGR03083 family)